jgi:hypothetical protein
MPAFSFEKILPPTSHAPVPPVEKKQGGVIVQILGRFVEARAERSERVEKSIIDRREQREPNQD